MTTVKKPDSWSNTVWCAWWLTTLCHFTFRFDNKRKPVRLVPTVSVSSRNVDARLQCGRQIPTASHIGMWNSANADEKKRMRQVNFTHWTNKWQKSWRESKEVAPYRQRAKGEYWRLTTKEEKKRSRWESPRSLEEEIKIQCDNYLRASGGGASAPPEARVNIYFNKG